MSIKRDQFSEEYKTSLDEACKILIETARRNPSGECWALVRAAGTETGDTFQIAVRKEPKEVSAEPVRHGRWIKLPESCQAGYECSECGAGIGKIKPPYCAICGAKMDLRTPTEAQFDEADSVMMGGAESACD